MHSRHPPNLALMMGEEGGSDRERKGGRGIKGGRTKIGRKRVREKRYDAWRKEGRKERWERGKRMR